MDDMDFTVNLAKEERTPEARMKYDLQQARLRIVELEARLEKHEERVQCWYQRAIKAEDELEKWKKLKRKVLKALFA